MNKCIRAHTNKDHKGQRNGTKIEWKILRHINSYKQGSKLCQLCLAEKLATLTGDSKILQIKRTELVSNCRRKNKLS